MLLIIIQKVFHSKKSATSHLDVQI